MRVSVIMPARNAQATVLEAVRSVLDQTHCDLELLFCDDGSSDATASIVDALDDPRLRRVRNDRSIGPGPSRDRLVAMATGDYIAVLDADDVFLPTRLERLLQVAPPGECLLFDDILECHETPSGLRPWQRVHEGAFPAPRPGDDVVALGLGDVISARRFLLKPLISLGAIRRLGVVHPALPYAEDGAFFWTLMARGVPAFHLPEALYLYRITPGSASASRDRNGLLADVVESLLAEDLDEPSRAAIVRRASFLRRLATFKGFSRLAWSARVPASLSFLIANPDVTRSFLLGLPGRAGYQISRLRHRGTRR
jgi:glycosyltransferase involved in cell wall biosynthesis